VPGTTRDERPNWSLALPVTVDELVGDAQVRAVAAALRRPPMAGPHATDR
jgi:hypothetical protein